MSSNAIIELAAAGNKAALRKFSQVELSEALNEHIISYTGSASDVPIDVYRTLIKHGAKLSDRNSSVIKAWQIDTKNLSQKARTAAETATKQAVTYNRISTALDKLTANPRRSQPVKVTVDFLAFLKDVARDDTIFGKLLTGLYVTESGIATPVTLTALLNIYTKSLQVRNAPRFVPDERYRHYFGGLIDEFVAKGSSKPVRGEPGELPRFFNQKVVRKCIEDRKVTTADLERVKSDEDVVNEFFGLIQ
jgi:hypothetical protein